MKNILLITLLFVTLFSNQKPLSHKDILSFDDSVDYNRGSYLIVLADSGLESYMDTFINLKTTQGFIVDMTVCGEDGFDCTTSSMLRSSILEYYNSNNMLEYVLLVGDVNGSYAIPSHKILSYNPPIVEDDTDYPNTYISDDTLNPKFFLGRWSVRSRSDLKTIRNKNIEYALPNQENSSYLNNALIVAGNYKTADGLEVSPQRWPVTPRYTSLWIAEQIENYHINNNIAGSIDTVFFTADNQTVNSNDITAIWNQGVGIVNYRGWGDASGWHKPELHIDDFNSLTTNQLPVVFSFVCNTGDFGNETWDSCFGEELVSLGSTANPLGAVAVVGPSDLDTDTRFNNVMCGSMWDAILDGVSTELGPALHHGKNSLIKEFGDLSVNGTNIANFYHHVYGVLGDPSISVWLADPKEIECPECNNIASSGSININITDKDSGDPIPYAVAALVGTGLDDNLVLLGSSVADNCGNINFESIQPLSDFTDIKLYLNKSQYFQQEYDVIYNNSVANDITVPTCDTIPDVEYDQYSVFDSQLSIDPDYSPTYNWREINNIGTNLNLTDDSVIKDVDLGFDFTYFGESYNSVTISSNGWLSFLPCSIPYFWNFSVPFPMGPSAMVAPFMDDLDDNEGTEPFNVYSYSDPQTKEFIVEWDNVANGETDDLCPLECDRETFQVILTARDDGNGDILFQYKDFNDVDVDGNFSTIGIESADQNFGIQYRFRGININQASDVEDGLAILFTKDGENYLDIDTYHPEQIYNSMMIYPNPFNPSTNIKLSIEKTSLVSIDIYDIAGKFVDTIVNNSMLIKGDHSFNWSPAINVPSGMYIARYNIGSFTSSNIVSYMK